MMKDEEIYLLSCEEISPWWPDPLGAGQETGRPTSIYHRQLDKEIQSSRSEEMRKSQTNTASILYKNLRFLRKFQKM